MRKHIESLDSPKFTIGEVVKHRFYPFRGVIFDVDPEFMNSEEWYDSIPKDIRPKRNQPFYHLFAENDDGPYIAYVSQQNLEKDDSKAPFNHPSVNLLFDGNDSEGNYIVRQSTN